MRLIAFAMILFLVFAIFGCTRTIEKPSSYNPETGSSGSSPNNPATPKEPEYNPKIESHGNYELILPKDYSADNAYPLLFCLHPGGNGKEYVNYLKPLAEDSGWIIAGSNTFQNGIPPLEFLPSVEGSIAEIKKSHKITNVYFCGFSGGGMGSYMSAYFKPGIYAGVISNDGTIYPAMRNSVELRKMRIKKAVVMSGDGDTVEPPSVLQQDEQLLKNAGIATKFISFGGGHQFAPVEKYREALEWLEPN